MDAPFLWLQEGHLSPEGLTTCFRDSFKHMSFFKVLQLKNIHFSKVPYMEVVCLEPQQYLKVMGLAMKQGESKDRAVNNVKD